MRHRCATQLGWLHGGAALLGMLCSGGLWVGVFHAASVGSLWAGQVNRTNHASYCSFMECRFAQAAEHIQAGRLQVLAA
jgi:hypothetical protein